jgi:hypothetical protein
MQIHILSSSVQHVLSVLSLLSPQQSFSGNGFQRRRSLNFRVHGFKTSLAVTAAPELN